MALNPPVRDWKDRRCWIIGASTGIGAALAGALAASGARLALSSRRREPLDEMAGRFGKGRSLALPLDITDAAALEKAAATIAKAWGGIDLVVLMAGEYKPMRAWELDLKAARAMVEVNLILRRQDGGPESRVCAIAFGPGLTVELATLTALPAASAAGVPAARALA